MPGRGYGRSRRPRRAGPASFSGGHPAASPFPPPDARRKRPGLKLVRPSWADIAASLLVLFFLTAAAAARADNPFGDTGFSPTQSAILASSLMAILAALVLRALRRRGAAARLRSMLTRDLDGEAREFFEKLELEGWPDNIYQGLDLAGGETPFFAGDCRKLEGRPAGLRTARGVITGRTRSVMASRAGHFSDGRLIATNKRLVFREKERGREWELRYLVSVTVHLASFEAVFSGEPKSLVFVVFNPVIWSRILVMAAGGRTGTMADSLR